MQTWKEELGNYDQELILEAESNLNLGAGTIEFPLGIIQDGSVDFDLEPKGVVISQEIEAIKHFISHTYSEQKPLRVLEVGANPMALDLLLNYKAKLNIAYVFGLGLMGGEESLKYPLSAHISRLEEVKVCAIDLVEPASIVNWLGAEFIQGDLLEQGIKDSILDCLGGRPDIILGRYVFVNDLDEYHRDEKIPFVGDAEDYGERVTIAAWDLLNRDGYIIVGNGKIRNSDVELYMRKNLPMPIKALNLSHFYWDTFTQVFKKP